ncbi:DCD (Development and cell death) domain protein [Quillaja saponaria]|uniref:DCD (Development and cell death) domain protein n=1 Tax=Quillaja saponaria TaxID=32244 RepID=A0AAD7L1A5_QUISA|nr:DCD (Development and cell death) domain protein [Quillaja saponaria]
MEEDSKNDAENPAETSSKPESNDTPKSLKAKSKIVKKPFSGKFKMKNARSTPQFQGRQRKRKNKSSKSIKESCNNGEEDAKNQISEEGCPQNEISDLQPTEKSHDAQKERDNQRKSIIDKQGTEKNDQAQKNKGKIVEFGKIQHNQRKKGKRGILDKALILSQKNKEKRDGMEKSRSNEKKKEKLGGLIFMCNAKTKPDCFRYRVMGVSVGKKDIVYRVKPGLKLFLYDFDLKLLYGIYKASSSGGMKFEPSAFGGAFPVQVRFGIHKDCFPLPESIFKKAIKENYNERHKFKTELTVRQVRKLTELFRPVETRLSLQSVLPPATVRDREACDGVRGSWSQSHREVVARDRYANGDARDQRILYQDVASVQREEIPHDLYPTEREYRAYGLQRERRHVTPPSHVNPTQETYRRDYDRGDRLRHLDPVYRDSVQKELVRANPLYLNENEYRRYSVGARHDISRVALETARPDDIPNYRTDPYYAYHNVTSPRHLYLQPLRRDEVPSSSYTVRGGSLIETDNLRRREAVEDRLYSTYAADVLSDYNRTQLYHGTRPVAAAPVQVSSRYSFAGPSFSYR